MKTNAGKQSRKQRRGDLPPLTNRQIADLTRRLCEDDQEKAEALLVLASDMRQRDGEGGGRTFPFYLVRQIAFSQCGNDAIDAQAELIRSELRV